MIVQMQELRKSFGATVVLDGVDLDVEEGEVVVVIGASGSGKSTLLRMVSNLETVSSGKLSVCGVALHELRGRADLHGQVGMVFQHFNLFPHLTAENNVALALRRVQRLGRAESTRKAHAALDQVGMLPKVASYPAQLSGGQQQRVAIARALALEPRLMLFDEATSALDPELVGEVTTVMRSLANGGMTMMIVTHEMRFARDVADHVVFIDHGRVVEQGSPEVVLTQPQNLRTQQFLERVINI